MKVCAHQPSFLPWVAVWNKFLSTDVLVLLRHSKPSKGDYFTRVQMGGYWASLPILGKSDTLGGTVFDVRALPNIAKTVEQRYMSRGCRYRDRAAPVVARLLEWKDPSLIALNEALYQDVASILGVSLNIVIGHIGEGDSTDARLFDTLYKAVPEMSSYYSGLAGHEYLTGMYQVPVLIQDVKNTYDGNTILQLIATEHDPIKAILDSVEWVNLRG